ncbi:hypothetical protein CVV68_05875 [Arthrobacter livingstonensis]|uniref:Uncharacterized protein n=1 Tax=Arthrobacter livingstonensis TaxID=670078 RepID=A0A2V5LB96_9MICC|nr:hypothetical protein CVV68_05875 [Arthrobacter livingstonensis]
MNFFVIPLVSLMILPIVFQRFCMPILTALIQLAGELYSNRLTVSARLNIGTTHSARLLLVLEQHLPLSASQCIMPLQV